jgi:S-DNA-T family DNA segregation ATPase FtsK/SpoIIIE
MVDVNLLDILDEEKYKNRKRPLTIALGCDVVSEPVLISLSLLPNILIGGMTNSGKSTCLANIISCLLVNNSPNELKILLMDMRRIEFSAFFDIPHLLAPVITDKDLAISAIDWLLQEVERRKVLFANQKFRNFEEYNAYVEIGRQLPFILVFIGELSDLITPTNNNVQSALAKIAGLARVTGVHLVVSSQRLTNDVITDVLKQNFTNRIVLKTSSQTDSTNILSHPGAEKLLGRGDMLFLETGKNAPTRVQGVLLSDDEIVRLIEFWKDQSI